MTETSSEQWGVLARRSSNSRLGGATAWCQSSKHGLLLFQTLEEAQRTADEFNKNTRSLNVSYVAARYR